MLVPRFLMAALAITLIEESFNLLIQAQECPLDLRWPNFTLAVPACSNRDGRKKCCRYMNAFVAVSIAKYTKTTGGLGVPATLTNICLDRISETLISYGIPTNATIFCGLGTKIPVSYICQGRTTMVEMMQTPNFGDVLRNCKMPLSSDNSCRNCLNFHIDYLHHLIGFEQQDNVTLSTCRDAAFVTLVNQEGNISAVDFASCFFSIKELIIHEETHSAPVSPSPTPNLSTSQPPTESIIAVPIKHNHHQNQLKLISGIGVMVIGLAILLLAMLIVLIRKKHRELKSADSHSETITLGSPLQIVQKTQEGQVNVIRRFAYKEIKMATENFRNVIGKGGFATVYKAQFDENSTFAVKRMKLFSEQAEKEFYREIELIGRLHHRHLVALRGFCLDRHDRFLIYEYLENGSVKDHLHATDKAPLTWSTRIQIAIDVANALEYLHFYCEPPLCHNDIKSSNILLDDNFLAKVADFGLTSAPRNTAVNSGSFNTLIQLTPGYIDPEFVMTQQLTEKSDVYSYGVFLLELITGRHAIQDNVNLVEWSQQFLEFDSKLPELIDPRISNSFDLDQLLVLVNIIQWCTEKEGTCRPSIKQVLRLLYEKFDPLHSAFLQAIEDEEWRMSKRKSNEDALNISSSSTSKSYRSHTVLLESSPPESPPTGIFRA